MSIDISKLPFGGQPRNGLITAGQPTAADLESLAAAGVKSVISLRPPNEDSGYDEAATAANLGLTYTVIPVASTDDLNLDNAQQLDAAIKAAGGAPVLVHCASSNRVGALLALRAAWIEGQQEEAALGLGRAGGLTKMEGAVCALLARGPA